MPTCALVVNPTKVDDLDSLRDQVATALRDQGWAEPLVLETTEDDPGQGMAREALERGVDLVLSAGGDGTVQAVCCALSGSAVPLGILPLGTGNLLARNLDLPLDLDEALQVALGGRDRRLDLGQVTLGRDGGEEQTCFAVMTGLGFDAEMMDDAPERLKSAVGWPAYVVSGVRHLRDRGTRLTLVLDGTPHEELRARGVIVGNVGKLQGGVALLPDARPDDGLLDLVVLAPRRLADWLGVLGRLVGRSRRQDAALHRHTAKRIEVSSPRPVAAEVDGEPSGQVRSLVVEVLPAAVTVRVPAQNA